MANTADKVINYALSQVGYLEKSKAAYKADPNVLYKFTEGAGSDNYTKYGKEMHDIYPTVMDFPAAWCDCFVDACFMNCYGVANAKALLGGDFNDYTVASAQLYKNKKAYYKKNPQVGDQIFFNNGTRICHTGLVYAVDGAAVDGAKVYTIEGNTSGGSTVIPNGGAVCKKSYPLNYERIDGYGRPKYDVPTETKKWIKINNDWYYAVNGEYIKDKWVCHKGNWYRLASDGKMLTGWQQIPDGKGKLSWCYFEESGDFIGAEWHERSDGAGYLERWTVALPDQVL